MFLVSGLCLLTWFFVWPNQIFAKESSVVISKFQNKGDEFVELYNPTNHSINLATFYLAYYSANKNWNEPYRNWSLVNASVLESAQRVILEIYTSPTSPPAAPPNPKIITEAGLPYSSGQLSDSNGSLAIFSFNPKNSSIQKDFAEYTDLRSWGSVTCVKNEPGLGCIPPEIPPPPPDPTPIPPELSSDKIRINEIFPAPSTSNPTREFVEFYNSGDKEESLKNWRLKDTNLKAGDSFCVLPEIKIAPKKYAVFYLANCIPSIALTNDGDSLYLYNPSNKDFVSSVSYDKAAPSNKFYAFDGTNWQWTSKDTEGEANEFDEFLSGKIKKEQHIYVGLYAEFETTTSKKAKHFTWDFGDGHKSYLKKARHKYEKTGTYTASLKITGDGKDTLLNFKVKVEKFPESKIKIISLSPNPKGKDSDAEFLTVQNNSKKKINLKNWSVATGSKNLYNHPIATDLWIKPNEILKITRVFSKFSLNNTTSKVELRYPNGKVASHLAYAKKKGSVAEDEIYSKTSGQWAWVAPKTATKLAVVETKPQPETTPLKKIALRKLKIQTIAATSGLVAGAQDLKQVPPPKTTGNYLAKIWTQINSFLNHLFLVFS